jgi:hypothetical protein
MLNTHDIYNLYVVKLHGLFKIDDKKGLRTKANMTSEKERKKYPSILKFKDHDSLKSYF